MNSVDSQLIKNIAADKNETEFQFRFFSEEGVGLLQTRTGASYFVLDSASYWYDLIQSKYPPVRKCSCKNDWFNVRFEYIPRDGYDDFVSIVIHLSCTKCGKEKPFTVDYRHSYSGPLYDTPIVFCEKPVIKYTLNTFAGYWTNGSLLKFAKYMQKSLNARAYCWYFDMKEHKRLFEYADYTKLHRILTLSRYNSLSVFFAGQELELNDLIEGYYPEGVYLKEEVWRKNELIHLSGPIIVASTFAMGRKYYTVSSCNQFVSEGEIIEKSDEFKEMAGNMLEWMKRNFSTERGKNCYDTKNRLSIRKDR